MTNLLYVIIIAIKKNSNNLSFYTWKNGSVYKLSESQIATCFDNLI